MIENGSAEMALPMLIQETGFRLSEPESSYEKRNHILFSSTSFWSSCMKVARSVNFR